MVFLCNLTKEIRAQSCSQCGTYWSGQWGYSTFSCSRSSTKLETVQTEDREPSDRLCWHCSAMHDVTHHATSSTYFIICLKDDLRNQPLTAGHWICKWSVRHFDDLLHKMREAQAYHGPTLESWHDQKEHIEGTIAIAIKIENFKEKKSQYFLCRQIKSGSTGCHGYKSQFTVVMFSSS